MLILFIRIIYKYFGQASYYTDLAYPGGRYTSCICRWNKRLNHSVLICSSVSLRMLYATSDSVELRKY